MAITPEALADPLLAGLANARQLFADGTVQERKRVVRAFVENLRVDENQAAASCGQKESPTPFRKPSGTLSMW